MYSEKCSKKYHVKKGDVVEVISGVWKKESGKIIAVLKEKDRVVLEMQGVAEEKRASRTGMRTVKKTSANPKGGMVERSVSVHVSNVRIKA